MPENTFLPNLSSMMIVCPDESRWAQAAELSRQTGLRLVSHLPEGEVGDYLLMDASGVQLCYWQGRQLLHFAVDFAAGKLAHRARHQQGRAEMVVKAVGVRGGECPEVLDITAGLGRDAFILAAAGCEVLMMERSPLLHALLAGALEQALEQAEDENLKAILGRLRLMQGDAFACLPELFPENGPERRPDVIYCDPMFPVRQKSAAVKKEAQILHRLVGYQEDADRLLPLARQYAGKKVVIKRPLHAPFLNDEKPASQIKGKSSRFDVYPV